MLFSITTKNVCCVREVVSIDTDTGGLTLTLSLEASCKGRGGVGGTWYAHTHPRPVLKAPRPRQWPGRNDTLVRKRRKFYQKYAHDNRPHPPPPPNEFFERSVKKQQFCVSSYIMPHPTENISLNNTGKRITLQNIHGRDHNRFTKRLSTIGPRSRSCGRNLPALSHGRRKNTELGWWRGDILRCH